MAYRLKALPLNAVKYEMFKVTICDFGKMNINMTDKIEKRRAANCVYHIGASIKDLGKVVWFLQDGNKIIQRANRPTLGLYLGYRRHFHVA